MKTLLKAFLPAMLAAVADAFVLLGLMRWGADWPDMPIFFSALAAVGSLIYFLPTSVAAFRDCPSYFAILVVNCIPVIGWVVALVWALAERQPEATKIIVQQVFYQTPPTAPTPQQLD